MFWDTPCPTLNSLGLCPVGITWEAAPGGAVPEGLPRLGPGVHGPEPWPCSSAPARILGHICSRPSTLWMRGLRSERLHDLFKVTGVGISLATRAQGSRSVQIST